MDQAIPAIQEICDNSHGRSQLFCSGSHGHLSGIRHYYESSSQEAKVSVEPGSAQDLAQIVEVIKMYRVEFAVKGGGHATNPKFSSTRGIHISMSRFINLSLNDDSSELTVGAGCVFDEIYKFIRPKGYNIVGGGGSVGIGGWLMGGGYSLKTNQYGLGIDNLVRTTIVTPEGRVGGRNNFGIATEFVLKTHRQGTHGFVYGGLLTYHKSRVDRVKDAIVGFMQQDDPKAAIVAAFRYYRNHGIQEFKFTVLAFYDDDKPRADNDPFLNFLAISHHGDLARSSYTTLDASQTLLYSHIPTKLATQILSSGRSPKKMGHQLEDDDFEAMSFPRHPGSLIPGISIMAARARWGNVMVSHYTLPLMNVIEAEAKAAKELMEEFNRRMAVADIWPFLPRMFTGSWDSDSAWPHSQHRPNGPLLVYFMWEGEENDEIWIDQMKVALDHIHQTAINESCTKDDAPVYCNTSLENVEPRQIYRDNLMRLSSLRRLHGPDNVMGLTGGFRIPFAQ